MYKIFFGTRRLSVCSPFEFVNDDPESVLFSPGSLPDLAQLPSIFVSNSSIKNLCIATDNQENTFKQLCTSLHRINAGGGLVTNKNGEYLLIYRYGKWDLPKGSQEPGEDIRYSAIREVSEECGLGIDQLSIGRQLCDTYHTFHRDGKFNLKFTRWFMMEYCGQEYDLVPQTEEHIEKAQWVKPNELKNYLSNTYPSILEVFERSGLKLD